jgi:predicted ATP-grasp superfamily ATP-dependent carboligase
MKCLGAKIVMAISEADALALNAIRTAHPGLTFLVPEVRQLSAVLDKATTLDVATAIGIDVPRTVRIQSTAELRWLRAGLRYPVVLKWSDPNKIGPELTRLGIPLLKTEYCESPEQLDEAMTRYEPTGQYPLVQEYCPGFGLGQMVLMVDGQPRLTFQHRRIHEWPPEGGVSTSCVSLPVDAFPEQMSKSVELLRRLNWAGPAMVEYRYDPATGRAVLMEINGRFWGSLPLASHAGALFAWNTYLTLGVGRPAEAAAIRSGVIARYMIPESRRLWRVLFEPRKIRDPFFKRTPFRDLAWFLLMFLHPRGRYYVFRIDDPGPFIRDVASAVGKLGRAAVNW